ncbi:ImmA/IrrE family metallo-endopeptidase [Pyxidicoccus fallax]|uniref:ImmA/IrrE family metallo-endopeptidase n=1 Tax=Pyxidicoccus fallax TaxID=394095 RepID=A0A848LI85_9BACT|nr:ImmA/IrrE family metallo-endopeptidase [Pyxidicoccus fallax]NMO17425.1 ImmA/IrrE family metallo-endopeptidase [Pyxidicoccus fallax]NPC77974.1 ImmA/IrrE family metallo-endopeptidase [Pyxidicoccus fallax]
MTARWLEEAVEACGSTAPPQFPRNLATEIPRRLPVTVVPLPQLTADAVHVWLRRRGLNHQVAEGSRAFHGCMVARAGVGILFHDSREGVAEQRFTVAHEVAHFVLDHWLPRQRALRVFGEDIRPVLDSLRAPTPEEALTALFERVPLGVQVKLMDRGPSGLFSNGKVAESERRADLLAQELLAPSALVMPLVREVSEDEGVSRVMFRFGLPGEVARTYVQMLRRRLRIPRFSIQQFLGVDGD